MTPSLLLVVLSLLLAPPAQEVKTVRECLLDGDSHVITEAHDLLDVTGTSVWAETDQDALRYGKRPGGLFTINTDTGPRTMFFVAYQTRLYLFVFQHPDRKLKVAPGVWDWHGSCMLRLNP